VGSVRLFFFSWRSPFFSLTTSINNQPPAATRDSKKIRSDDIDVVQAGSGDDVVRILEREEY